jgi:hypothetical protein
MRCAVMIASLTSSSVIPSPSISVLAFKVNL